MNESADYFTTADALEDATDQDLVDELYNRGFSLSRVGLYPSSVARALKPSHNVARIEDGHYICECGRVGGPVKPGDPPLEMLPPYRRAAQ